MQLTRIVDNQEVFIGMMREVFNDSLSKVYFKTKKHKSKIIEAFQQKT